MDELIRRFKPPPLCASNPDTLSKTGDRFVFCDRMGKNHKATLDSNNKDDRLYLKFESIDEVMPMPASELLFIESEKKYTWISVEVSEAKKFSRKISGDEIVEYKLILENGKVFEGKTIGYREDNIGVFFYPTIDNKHFTYYFAPHDVIKEKNIGPKLGEQLVKDKLVTHKDIKDSLEEQKNNREKKIGQYFIDNKYITADELDSIIKRSTIRTNLKLGEFLLEEGYISQEQLNEALEIQKNTRKKPLGQILVENGTLNVEQLNLSLAKKLGVPIVDPTRCSIDKDALSLVPRQFAEEHSVFPLMIYKHQLILVMLNVLDHKLKHEVEFLCSKEVTSIAADKKSIQTAIEKNYRTHDDLNFDDAEHPDIDDEIEVVSPDVSENKIVKLASRIIEDAYKRGASDVHIEPNSITNKTIVRFRIDGLLEDYLQIPAQVRKALVSRYKVMASLDISNRLTPQDGKIKFSKYSKLKIELRLATIPTVGGEEDLVIRLLAGGKPLKLEELNLTPENLESIKYVLSNPHGLFLVCGPTGSGKTTTLHTVSSYLNTRDRKIWTVEDPVEITQPGLRQVQVDKAVGLDFAKALRSFLRADPDIIMVGEIRDSETSKIAIEAALTGHLILSTLHTNSAVETTTRLLEMGIDPFNFSDALIGILAQRLTRKLCDECKEAYTDDDILNQLAEEYMYDFEINNIPKRQFSTKGIIDHWRDVYGNDKGEIILYRTANKECHSCDGSGYKGRVAIHELLLATDEIKLAIYRKEKPDILRKIAISDHMRTLKQDGIEKVVHGLTDILQIRKVCAAH